LATLSAISAPRPLKASLSLPHSWDSPFEAFFRSEVEVEFLLTSPLSRFVARPYGPGTGALAISSLPTSCALSSCIPRFLLKGLGHLLPWAFCLSGIPFVEPGRTFLWSLPPLSLFHSYVLAKVQMRSLRVLLPTSRHLPPKWTPARMTLSTDCRTRPFWESNTLRTIFSS
jgi:hypothetical protein